MAPIGFAPQGAPLAPVFVESGSSLQAGIAWWWKSAVAVDEFNVKYEIDDISAQDIAMAMVTASKKVGSGHQEWGTVAMRIWAFVQPRTQTVKRLLRESFLLCCARVQPFLTAVKPYTEHRPYNVSRNVL